MVQYRLIAKYVDGYRNELTEGKIYITLEGIEEGVFPDRPYVTFIGDDNKEHSCHASRFVMEAI